MTMKSFFIKQKTGKQLTWKARILILVVLAVFFVLTSRLWLVQLGQFLICEHKLQPADLIVVQGGGDRERIQEAARLYHQDYARRLLISGHTPEDLPGIRTTHEELGKREAIRLGVQPEDIVIEGKSTSSRESAVFSRPLFERYKVDTIILISEPYHLRRSYLTYRKVYPTKRLKIICRAPRNSWYKGSSWWQSERGLIATSNEYIKLAYYLLKGYI